MRYYEDLEPGTAAKGTIDYLVTEEEILEMGRRRGTLVNQRDEPVFSYETAALIHCRA